MEAIECHTGPKHGVEWTSGPHIQLRLGDVRDVGGRRGAGEVAAPPSCATLCQLAAYVPRASRPSVRKPVNQTKLIVVVIDPVSVNRNNTFQMQCFII